METESLGTGPAPAPAAEPTRAGLWRARIRWELLAYAALVVVALGMRLWDLGGRSLHYDEILHAWYSWRYAEGLGYSHTPLMHGPFLFHVAGATYKLFGSSDLTARLVPALFGAVLVGLPYLLRRELGRPAALIAAVLLAASPSILYFSRFIRNDIYMAVWTLALVVVMWRYLERPRTALLVAWAALWALAFTTKETSYITAGILGLYLVLLALPDIRRWVSGRMRLRDLPPPAVLLLLLVTLTLPLWGPVLGLVQDWLGVVLVNPDPNDPVAGATRAATDTGRPVGVGTYVAVLITVALIGVSMLIGLLWDRRRWPVMMGVFLVIFLLFFSSFGSNWRGIFTGGWGSLGYWVAQQPVERAGQPWYFYLILSANYEFLALLPALVGAPFLLQRGRRFDLFVVFWAVATFAAFSYAGERMPWLMVGITLPLAVLTARSLGLLVEWLPWRRLGVLWAAAPMLLGALALAMATLVVLTVVRSETSASSAGIGVGLALAVPAGVGLAAIGWRRGVGPTLGLAGLGVAALLLGMTVYNAGRASYSYAGYERPTEMLVYSQTGQETTRAARLLDRIARESGKGKEGLRLMVGESDNFSWQWRWYARDYPNLTFRSFKDSPLEGPPDVDVVLMSQTVEFSNRDALEGFTRVGELHHLWWFPNFVYKDVSSGDALGALVKRDGWRGAVDYFFSRRLGSEMYRAQGVVYVADSYAGLATELGGSFLTPSGTE